MGANVNLKQEAAAIKELSALSREAKDFLNHHIGSSVQNILSAVELKKPEEVTRAAWHIIDDLFEAGIRNTRR